MGACMSSGQGSVDAAQALVVDVQKVIIDNAWRDFQNMHLKWWNKRFKKRRDYTVEVPMNYFLFEQIHQELSIKNNDKNKPKNGSSSPQEKLPQSEKTSPKHMRLQTYFRNDTDEKQYYKFCFEKARRSSAHVSYQKGFSFGGATDFSVNLPKILPGGELGAELDMHMEVTKTEEQTFEEKSVTSITSDVILSSRSVCVVDVILENNHFTANFKLHVIMMMPSEKAVIFIRGKRGQVLSTSCLNNLALLFPNNRIKDQEGKVRADAVQFVVEGVINATQVSNQRIEVDSKPA